MISGTYLLSGALLAFSAWLFAAGVLSAAGQTFIWIVIFFFASAGASAGYLTVSEIFPIEIRAEALAVFFALAQIFGAVGPVFYGFLIGAGTNRANLAIGYLVGGAIMIIGGLVELSVSLLPFAPHDSGTPPGPQGEPRATQISSIPEALRGLNRTEPGGWPVLAKVQLAPAPATLGRVFALRGKSSRPGPRLVRT